MNVVECISLTKNFQDFWGRDRVRAVDQLSFEIRPGEIFGLLGPNGSGKSTTIKMLLGLLYPTSGTARVFGQPPTDTTVKRRIGFMPEESYLYRFLNAYETLDYYGKLFRLDGHERKRRIEQLIDMVGLKRAGKRPVGTYSKGMARRIGLAQALINDPDLLILDEPTTGLDPIGTRQIKDVIRVLGERGKTVLLCSHLLADVEDVCDRVAIMYGGKLQALGTVEELLERRDTTQIVTRELDESTINRLKQVLKAAGRDVLSIEHPTDRLEDVFLRVVGKAHREKLETSGVEGGAGVSEFLGGKADGRAVVEALLQAGRQAASPPAERGAAAPHEEPAPRRDLLEKLTSGEVRDALSAPADEPAEAPVSRKVDRAVLDKLIQSKRDDTPGGGAGA